MEYEWDRHKADANLAKHGIDFVAAVKVFDDPGVLIRPDNRYAEPRFQAIGTVKGLVLFVGFAMRGDVYRIITARRANRRERQKYRPLQAGPK